MTDHELAHLRETLASRDAELSATKREIANLLAELENTNHGLIALHAELEQARQAEAQLAAIVQSSDDAMYSLTPERRIQTWNAGAERLLGYAASEIIGRPIETIIPDELVADFRDTFDHVVGGHRAATFETRRRRRDGTTVDVAITLSAIHDPDGGLVGVSAVLRDITRRLEVERALAEARAEQEVLGERDRIARDLHDHVIQRIFAAGMALEGVGILADDPRVTERLRGIVTDLDATITDIRTTIFAIKHHGQRSESLRAQIVAIADDARAVLGFAPAVRFHGPIDISVPGDVGDHALAVVREALSNVARHAHASEVVVTVRAAADLSVEVADDGRGVGDVARRSGLANLRERAEVLGGTFEIASGDDTGTTLTWRVPLEV